MQNGYVAQSPGVAASPATQPALAQLLANPLVAQWVERHPEQVAARLGERFRALDNEHERRWERVTWLHDAETAKQAALRSAQPIFVEMVVGRYGDAANALC